MSYRRVCEIMGLPVLVDTAMPPGAFGLVGDDEVAIPTEERVVVLRIYGLADAMQARRRFRAILEDDRVWDGFRWGRDDA